MSIQSQYLLFYIDELIRVHWVDWSNNYLSHAPDPTFASKKGFQEITHSTTSTTRTRALELFKLGLINSKLIAPRSGGNGDIPKGWMSICNDESIHTNIGYLSYVIGTALRNNEKKKSIDNAFSALCTILIVGIGFKFEDRWYSTVNIFLHVKQKLESTISRKLNSIELRYLSGAVFNTLDNEHADQLIDSYKKNNEHFKLHFKIREQDSINLMDPEAVINLSNDESFRLDSIQRQKACLFWSDPERGHFCRATELTGYNFLESLTEVDKELVKDGKENIFTAFYESVEAGEIVNDLITIILDLSTVKNGPISGVNRLMKTLHDGVIDSLELIQQNTTKVTIDKFYLHDEIQIPLDGEVTFTIHTDGLPIIPQKGNTLILTTGEELIIQDIQSTEEVITIEAQQK